MALRGIDLCEQFAGSIDPRPDGRSPTAAQALHRAERLTTSDAGHLRHPCVRGVDHLRNAVAADDREPRTIDDLPDGHGRCSTSRRDLGRRHVHRAGGVDDDDLGGVACDTGLPRSDAAHRDDGMNVGGPVGQVLVLEHVSLEFSHW